MPDNNNTTPTASIQEGTYSLRRLWRDIIESIRGSEQEYTTGSIGRAILLLSIPMVLEMVMESVFAVVDIFFVSKLGAEAVATVGLTESMLTIVYAISIGLAMATTAVVSRRVGEKNYEGAAVATVQAILSGIIVSVIIAIPGIFYSSELLLMMGASDEVVETGSLFTQIMISSNIIIMLLFIINAVFRGAGDAAYAMRILWIANIINIILDPCLILGLGPFPELGVTGAAVATAIGRGTGVVLQIILLLKRSGRIKISRAQIRFDFPVMRRLLRLSLGGIGQFLIATSSWIGLMRIMAVFGSEALAGYTIAIRIIVFSILPSWGMSNAAATLVGQNLGAKKPERAEKSVWVSAFVNMAFLCGIGALFLSIPEFLIRLFTEEEKIVEIGAQCLRYLSFGYPFYAFGMVMTQAFNGAGDTTTPTILNFICFWLVEIPLAYLLALQLNLSEPGVFLAIISSESLLGVLGIIVFRRGKWKLREV
jgi:putative MATE family efflux protein